MQDLEVGARTEVLAKLARSRQEVRHLLDPPREESDGGGPVGNGHDFPRSKTMRLLMSGRGLGTLGALAGGLLMARPGLALRLLRMVPASTVAKMLIARTVSALKAKPEKDG